MKLSSGTLIALHIAALAALSVCEPAQAVQWPNQYADNVKNYLVNLVKDRVISKSKMMSNFQDTMATIKSRYDTEKESLETDASDAAQQALYYKIVVEELRNLRSKIEKEPAKDADGGVGLDDFKHSEGAYPVPNLDETVDPVVDDAEEHELLNQLDELENLQKEEDEMGWSLSAESRELLKERTKKVLIELCQNELRQLAMAIVTSYMSGSPLGPIAAALAGSIRFKMVEYLMNMVMDVLSSLMGRRVNIQPEVAGVNAPIERSATETIAPVTETAPVSEDVAAATENITPVTENVTPVAETAPIMA